MVSAGENEKERVKSSSVGAAESARTSLPAERELLSASACREREPAPFFRAQLISESEKVWPVINDL